MSDFCYTVRFNKPMVYIREYYYSLKDTMPWLGLDGVFINVPINANKIVFLKAFDLKRWYPSTPRDNLEMFFINKFGYFIDLPETIDEKTVFSISDIEELVVAPSKQSKEIKQRMSSYLEKETLEEKTQRVSKAFGIIESINNSCRGSFIDCVTNDSFVLKDFAYWYASITNEELKFKAECLIKQDLEILANINDTIENTLSSIVKEIMIYFQKYGASNVEDMVQHKCKELEFSIKGEQVNLGKRKIEHELVVTKDFDLSKKLCEELESRVSECITNNASWLKDTAKGVIRSLTCNVEPFFRKK